MWPTQSEAIAPFFLSSEQIWFCTVCPTYLETVRSTIFPVDCSHPKMFFLPALILVWLPTFVDGTDVELTLVDTKPTTPLPHIWENTGWCVGPAQSALILLELLPAAARW